MRGLTKKSLVTLNSPPSGRRRMEILTTFSQPQRRYYRLLMLQVIGLLAVPMVWPYAYTFFV